jgi:hypothetical protein
MHLVYRVDYYAIRTLLTDRRLVEGSVCSLMHVDGER